jgi:hypothetical protein
VRVETVTLYSSVFVFFFFFGEISPTADKRKPSATSRKELQKRTSRTFAIFLRKKKKRKEEFARFKQ